jgi:dienelactone hydrolase
MSRFLRFSSNGKSLFGVLHEPSANLAPVGVVFLNAGPQNRVGPQRIYLRAARRFCELGVTCLRVDLPGIGESEGSRFDGTPDSFDPADVRGAIDLLVSRGVTTVVLLGLCAGARAAVRAGRRDGRVDAVVCWSVPIVSGASEFDGFSTAATRALLWRWAKRLLQPWRWIDHLASRQRFLAASAKLRAALATVRVDRARHDTPGFVEDVRALLATRRGALFAFGERDIGAIAEFEQYFADVIGDPHPDHRVVLVEDGDHTFSSIEARERVIGATAAWLAECRNRTSPRP